MPHQEALHRTIATAIAQAQESGADVNTAAFNAAKAFKAALAAFDVTPRDMWRSEFAEANLNAYTGDDYPRVGCTLLVLVKEKGWSLRVYAPGYAPIGEVGCIDRYPDRAHGSTGIAVDTVIQIGSDTRPAMPAMRRAELAYAAASESNVIS